jgi:hypothetical protein
MGILNLKPGHQSPNGLGLYAQVRPSSVAKYPFLELDRWYRVRKQDHGGCFIEMDGAQMYLKIGHYVCREGRRGADRLARVPALGATVAEPSIELPGR